MNVEFHSIPFSSVAADALLMLHFEDDASPAHEWFSELAASGEAKGKVFDLSVLHRPAGFAAKRLVAAGAGPARSFTPAVLRKVTGAAVRALKTKGVRSIALCLDHPYAEAALAAAAVEGAVLGNYEVDVHKSEGRATDLATFHLVSPADLAPAVAHGETIAQAQNFARGLVNEPGNLLPPLELAARAAKMAGEQGLDCEILDEDRMRQLGMGSLLGVAMGSDQPPAMIILRYTPATPSPDHLCLIGKGVTFDTGGVSIKPSDGMEKMKYDMAGGAAVLGAMQAIAQLKPPVAVTAIVPTVENMCGGRALRPGDIVTSLSGKTIEVLNTDAEGRLILVDAIEYARRLGVTHMVDAATLTGAIVVALGHVHVGAFTNDEEMLGRVLASARAQGENLWHMPLDDDYKDYLKTPFADLPNIGGRWGGAVTAAYFLKEWTGGTPWVHLDIAGTAWLEETKPFLAKGPTGVCVRTFIDLALNWR
ncbi:MAG: leucyl aminopeptidase [Acidobacteriota bacterium]|jgi:leucyl aminopeptidase